MNDDDYLVEFLGTCKAHSCLHCVYLAQILPLLALLLIVVVIMALVVAAAAAVSVVLLQRTVQVGAS